MTDIADRPQHPFRRTPMATDAELAAAAERLLNEMAIHRETEPDGNKPDQFAADIEAVAKHALASLTPPPATKRWSPLDDDDSLTEEDIKALDHALATGTARPTLRPQRITATPPPADVEAVAKVLFQTWFGMQEGTVGHVWLAVAAEAVRLRDDAVREAVERCAKVIEDNQEGYMSGSDGTTQRLSPRSHGNIAGLSYAAAIRAGYPATVCACGQWHLVAPVDGLYVALHHAAKLPATYQLKEGQRMPNTRLFGPLTKEDFLLSLEEKTTDENLHP